MVKFKINSIHIEGFKSAKRKVDLVLAETQTSTIYGKNGCGKTTLLYILSAVLGKNEQILKENKVETVTLKCQKDDKDFVLKVKAIKKEDTIESYAFVGYENFEEKSLFITTDRGLNTPTRRKISIDDVMKVLKELSESDSGFSVSMNSSISNAEMFVNGLNSIKEVDDIEDIFKKENLLIDNITMNTVEKLMIRNYKEEKGFVLLLHTQILFKVIDTLQNQQISDFSPEKIMGIYTKYEEYKNIVNRMIKVSHDELKNLSSNMKKLERDFLLIADSVKKGSFSIEKQVDILISVRYMALLLKYIEEHRNGIFPNDIIKQVFEKYARNKEIHIDNENVHIKSLNDMHDLNLLSNGERQFLTFITILVSLGKDKSVILIDEPDISLDTDWQENFVSIIETLCPNAQIIYTTHSPYISVNDTNMICNL